MIILPPSDEEIHQPIHNDTEATKVAESVSEQSQGGPATDEATPTLEATHQLELSTHHDEAYTEDSHNAVVHDKGQVDVAGESPSHARELPQHATHADVQHVPADALKQEADNKSAAATYINQQTPAASFPKAASSTGGLWKSNEKLAPRYASAGTDRRPRADYQPRAPRAPRGLLSQ